MACPHCGSPNVQFQTVIEDKPIGCGMGCLYLLLALTILGLLIVIPLMLRKRTETVTYGVCQNCGTRWEVSRT